MKISEFLSTETLNGSRIREDLGQSISRLCADLCFVLEVDVAKSTLKWRNREGEAPDEPLFLAESARQEPRPPRMNIRSHTGRD